MSHDFNAFLRRQHQRKRKEWGQAFLSADMIRRRNQQTDIEKWAKRAQADNHSEAAN